MLAWLLPRVLTAMAVAGFGAAMGWLAADAAGLEPMPWAFTGVLLGVALAVTFDLLRALALLRWLRGAQVQGAPRAAGVWGELAHRVERALRSREHERDEQGQRLAQLLAALDAAPSGVVLIDDDDRIEWCNVSAADHLGIDPVRDLRQRVGNLVRAPAFVAHLQSRRIDRAVSFSLPGRQGTLSVWVRPYGSDGHRLLLSQDITERQRTDEMRRDFVANVSHEMRTPLTVLAGSVDTMEHIELSQDDRRRVLALMKEQSDRMRTLLDDLLVLAQLESGARPPVDQWVDVGALMQRLRVAAEAVSAGRHALRFEGGGAQIAGAEQELFGAMQNLVVNAVHCTPPGGTIEVGWLAHAQGGGTFEVRDSGIGIAREHLARLGERFYRIDVGRSRGSGGTGLGLAIAKHAVQRHGGELQVDSELGRGSTFRLVFGAARVRQHTHAPAELLGAPTRR